jgi:rhomboid protease GluP
LTLSAPEERPGADADRVYSARPLAQLRLGATLILISLLGLTPFKAMSRWIDGGPTPESGAFLALVCLLLFPFGLIGIFNAIRRLPRLTIDPVGITLQFARTKWANWDSLDPFVVKLTQAGRFSRKVKTASARVTGPNASKGSLRSKMITFGDFFDTPVEEIVADLNAVRASSLGVPETMANSMTVPEPAPVGLPGFTLPWLTFGLLGVLIGVFVLENKFPVTPGVKLTPSLQTLIALGALNHTAVISGGEWYRLFTAPLLHASLSHLVGNGVALLLGGWSLERLVGRLWYFAFFAISALGGSLVSLAVGAPNLSSVGASGALMGMFAGLFVSSFRLASGSTSRARMQVASLRILFPSLLPFFSASAGTHIDYGAHFGGALAGTALALALLRSWPETAIIPQWRYAASVIVATSFVLFAGSAGMAIANYPKYDVAVIPAGELPKTTAESRERAATLVARYPDDPRSHLYLAEALTAASDQAGAERELRLSLVKAEAHSAVFGTQQALLSRGVLARFLAQQGRQDEAKVVARETCGASSKSDALKKFVEILTTQHLCE